MSEYLDVVDDEGVVIGKATHEEVYEKKLSHRIVHIMIVNPQTNELYLQQRAMTKSFLPGYFCTSAGGHVQSGESYMEAAKREMNEEIGLDIPLKEVHQFLFESDGLKRFISLFVGFASDGFRFQDGEVLDGIYLSFDDALALVKRGEKVHPQLDPCIRWLYSHQEVIQKPVLVA